ncbi:hypothetical protein PBV87_00980 [Niameybacter massiliensis]|uniref:Uncharacterized protein n=1 Tax=Holtiella tumoricola TaxID=3018743 RepID=A0AA42DJG7_9FIRM|nr:hypothetical protein [Holtiella tumoricola]MDA3730087.1 hypothetical protein [Holtiella tumoricola]
MAENIDCSEVECEECMSEEIIQYAKAMYYNLNENERMIFEKVISEDKDLIEFHKKYINPSYTLTINSRVRRSAWGEVTSAVNALKNNLNALNLSAAVRYALIACGTGGVGAALEPTLVGEAIAAIIVGVPTVTVVALNWDEVSKNWDGIVKAFEDAFRPLGRKVTRSITVALDKLRDKAKRSEKDEPKVEDVAGRSGWTKEKSEDEVLSKVNGKKAPATKGRDGTVKIPVVDKKTGKVIGEIHLKQPVKGKGKTKYPSHYHDKTNKLGKGSGHHWYW